MDKTIPIQLNILDANAFINQYHNNADEIYKVENIETFESSFIINKLYMLLTHDNIFHCCIIRSLSPIFTIGIIATSKIYERYAFLTHEMKQKAFLNINKFKTCYKMCFPFENSRTQHSIIAQEHCAIDEEIDDNNNYVNNMTCNICMMNKVAVCYSPCGHVACNTCSSKITKCQTCRINIVNKVKFFI